MGTVFADVRYAFRVMSRTPSFAVAVVSVLALGIGANTAIFSIVNAVLLRPLPFEAPEQLVRIFIRRQTVDLLSSRPASSTAGSRTRSRSTASQCINAAASGSSRSLARLPREQYMRQRQCGLFRNRQSPTGARTRLWARGGHARRQARSRPERPVLENRVRRTSGRDRPHGEAQRRNAHHRRCHASHCLGRVMDRDGERRLGPARTHRRAARRPWESQSGRCRASEARCRPGAGASRNGRNLRTARA